jgi:hypothetical protein
MNILRVVLVLSIVTNFWFVSVIVDLEKFRYSAQVGLCGAEAINVDGIMGRNIPNTNNWLDCLRTSQPRTSDFWNLYYALSD